jgi:eukaryotic-like serine/threonine-protein kinase
MRCPYCGIEQFERESFCEHCGSNMELPATTTIAEGSLNTRLLIPGARLQNDRYVIKKGLGQGGMGSVFLATDTRLARKLVVVKALMSDDMDPTRRQEDVRNFKHEVETLAHLDHPLIPSVTDHFQEGSHYCMVQEYVEGETLQARMDRFNQPMKEHVALRYASEVLDILDYLSQQVPAIVHRDIKPANIISGAKDRRAHLVDFGIARKDTPSSTRRKQTTALGTPGYAPPEQYQGNADPRSDLYALAATLHYLLTNRDPGEYVLFQYPPVRQLNPLLSPDTEVLLALALAKDANQRYQSAQAMKRDIENILLRYFEISGDRRSYESGYSIPGGANPRLSRASQPVRVQQQLQVHPMQLPVNHPPVAPYQPLDMYAGVEHWLSRSNVGFHFVLFVLFISLIAAAAFVAIGYAF